MDRAAANRRSAWEAGRNASSTMALADLFSSFGSLVFRVLCLKPGFTQEVNLRASQFDHATVCIMLVHFTQTNRHRIIGELEWSPENRHVAEVSDAALLAELFTDPRYDGKFVVAQAEPLVAIVGSVNATLLPVEMGLTSVAELAELDQDGRKALASRLLETTRTVNGWVEQARKLIGADEEAGEQAEH